MPNWVKNIVRIAGNANELESFKNAVSAAEDSFDFNKLVPMPSDLQIESGSSGENGLKLLWLESKPEERNAIEEAYRSLNPFFRHLSHTDPSAFENVTEDKKESWRQLAKRYLENFKLYGHCTWYTWAYDNWGTKWPAYAEEPSFVRAGEASYLEYIFTTAWSAPLPVFRKAIEQYPDLAFRGAFSDEDTGSGNCGIWYKSNDRMKAKERDETFAKAVWSYPEEGQDEDRFP